MSRWLTASAFGSFVLFVVGCGSGGEQPAAGAAQAAKPAPSVARAGETGATYFMDWGCDLCHGSDRAGTEMAPALVGLKARWSVDDLATYLLNPAEYRASHPLGEEAAARWADIEMPEFDFPQEERAALARWLIEEPFGAP